MKNILIIGSNSELAKRVIQELKNKDYNIFATSRTIDLIDKDITNFHLDVAQELDFIHIKDKLHSINFDTIINFTGIAIAGAIEDLSEIELKKQLEINLFGLLKIIKYFCPNLKKDGKLINISSMASYGIFPYLAPYCISKSSADIMLNLFSIESNIKTVSIRPGATATKFWESSIKLNQKNFENCSKKFEKEKEFLIQNANKNSLHATNPIYVAKKIAKIIELKNPKAVYNIGSDSKIAKLTRFLPQDFVNGLVKFILKKRLKK